jgi:hypothetical protein
MERPGQGQGTRDKGKGKRKKKGKKENGDTYRRKRNCCPNDGWHNLPLHRPKCEIPKILSQTLTVAESKV